MLSHNKKIHTCDPTWRKSAHGKQPGKGHFTLVCGGEGVFCILKILSTCAHMLLVKENQHMLDHQRKISTCHSTTGK